MIIGLAGLLLLLTALPVHSGQGKGPYRPDWFIEGLREQFGDPDRPDWVLERLREKERKAFGDFKRLREDVEIRLKELKTLEEDYAENGITKEIEARRAEIRAALGAHLVQTKVLKERYRKIDKLSYGQATRDIAVGLVQGVAERMYGAHTTEAKYMEISRYRRRLRRQLGFEAEAYQKVLSHRERIRKYALAGGLVLVIIAGALAVRRLEGPRAAARAQALERPAAASGSAPPVPTVPELLDGNFRMGRQIGSGGMGLVFAATDEALGRKVAIKRMKKEVLENRRELDMFIEEARLVAALKHPDIVEIHSIVREGGQLYLVFEYVEGRTLKQLLEDEGRLPHDRTVSLLRQVAGALDYAHSKKVIHRDLKPANIMIGKDDAVKVMDFGLAHQAKKTVAKLTRAVAWGTPPYMSPEQELGKVSRESDIYSVGVVYYEMLTGEPVFIGPDFLKQKREMDYEPATKLRPELPAGVDAIVRKVLAVRPEDRFHTGAEFIAVIEMLGKA